MNRIAAAVVVAVLAVLATVTSAHAAPNNKHSDTFPVQCDGLTVMITVNENTGENSLTPGFVSDPALLGGTVGVPKSFAGTLSINGVVHESFSRTNAKGIDPSRLITCTGEFTETDPDTGDVFTFTFIAKVMVVGRPE